MRGVQGVGYLQGNIDKRRRRVSAARGFLDALQLFDISNNLGDSKSLITHPATTTHRSLTDDERAAIGLQSNSAASLVVDDPLKIGECFFERSIGFTKTEMQELIYQLPAGDLRDRLETQFAEDGWQVNGNAIRAALANGAEIAGARLVKGHHIRIR